MENLRALINNWICLVRDKSVKDIEVQHISLDEEGDYKIKVRVVNNEDLVLPYEELVQHIEDAEHEM